MVRRLYVEKKQGFDFIGDKLYHDLTQYGRITNIRTVRSLIRYDIEGIDDETYTKTVLTVFSEPPVDTVYEEDLHISESEHMIAVQYLPGQYDQRADSAEQCICMISPHAKPTVHTALIYVFSGVLSKQELTAIKRFIINPVDSHEVSLEKKISLQQSMPIPGEIESIEDFTTLSASELSHLHAVLGLAMSQADLIHCQNYFRDSEKRNPTLTEIRMLDTYWSDHCRHTTFLTSLEPITIQHHELTQPIQQAYLDYLAIRRTLYGSYPQKPVSLMDIATIGMKHLKQQGLLQNHEESSENNACSIIVEAIIDGKPQEWLVQFKNETHNHPTEIEPYGGAATCLGGAIRDPLSGRSFVYQAMRVTGSGDPRTPIEKTLPGKLPQRKITSEAAAGYSSYGNQIGLATGMVTEIYHEGYVAKRMEIGAVIGASPRSWVRRDKPVPGDVILLVGGRTGRDGLGGATGSSKAHTEQSMTSCGAEVQKGNAPQEHKLQRLFRDPAVCALIKKCNDFGAGGVSVAIGELADGVLINLDLIPKKYEGLNGTDLALSESQERMAVVVDKDDVEKFIRATTNENLEAVAVATVTLQERVTMLWKDKKIVDISRTFLNTNGASQKTSVTVTSPDPTYCYFTSTHKTTVSEELWLWTLSDLNACSQKGLIERFDSSIGAGSVLMPFGGIHQTTPAQCMVAKLPVLHGNTETCTIMSHGFNPFLSSWSPFHGAVYALLEAVAKVVAVGGDYKQIKLSLQEYFERLGTNPQAWGKPFSALLGALYCQKELSIAAIGGKDSMSGTFENISVPPTLVAFAVCPSSAEMIISPEFKNPHSTVIFIPIPRTKLQVPDFEKVRFIFSEIHKAILSGSIISASVVGSGCIAETVTKMCFGNSLGFTFDQTFDTSLLFKPETCAFICETSDWDHKKSLLGGAPYAIMGMTTESNTITIGSVNIGLDKAFQAWKGTLEPLFASTLPASGQNNPIPSCDYTVSKIKTARIPVSPQVLIVAFPGTNCEYDAQRSFATAGAHVSTFVIKNLTANHITQTLKDLAQAIDKANIVMLPGGFSAGDEPDGSAKFIAAVFRNPLIMEAVNTLLYHRDGLMLGICNGFQALIKLGLLPFGQIAPLNELSPTITFNTISRHVSTMVQTRISSILSPWFADFTVGDIHTIPVSHGEGRFIAPEPIISSLASKGQIVTQYVDLSGNPTMEFPYNPNGSLYAVEGICSPDGRIVGKMAHSERYGNNVAKNIPGNKNQNIFRCGVQYFQ